MQRNSFIETSLFGWLVGCLRAALCQPLGQSVEMQRYQSGLFPREALSPVARPSDASVKQRPRMSSDLSPTRLTLHCFQK